MKKNQEKWSSFDFESIRVFFLPVLVVALGVVSFFLVLKPKIDEVGELRDSIKIGQTRLGSLTKKLSLLKTLDSSILSDQLELALRALPENKRPLLVMRVLKKLGSESGVAIVSLGVNPGSIATPAAAPSQKKASKGALGLTFSLKFTGSTSEIRDFIEKLTKTLPLLRLTKVSLQRAKGKDHFSASTEVVAFYSFVPKSLGKIESPVKTLDEGEEEFLARLEEFSFPLPDETPFLFEAGRENPFL
jgi:hypothetical protein